MGVKGQRRIYYSYIILILGSILGYGFTRICSFTLFPDEFGYWASAAKMAGYDWQDMTALGSYYSFGYGLLLFPILKLAGDGITAYHMALGLNLVLMWIAVWLLLGIVRELFPGADEVKQILCAGIGVFYPSWIYYMQMTMTEALLMFLYVLFLRVYLSFLKHPGILKSIVLAVTAGYMYCVHMRSLGIVLSCMVVLAIMGWKRKESRRAVICGLAVLLLSILLAGVLKQWAVGEVFTKTDAQWLNTNDYGGILKKISVLFNGKGFLYFLLGILGKILYLWCATFGLFHWAFAWGMGKVKKMIKSEEESEKIFVAGMAALFLLMSFGFELLLSAVYLAKDRTIDSLVYGRYIEFLMPVFISIGILVQKTWKLIVKKGILWGSMNEISAVLMTLLVAGEQRAGLRGYMVVGISHFIKETDFVPWKFFLFVWLGGMVMFLFTSIVSRLTKENRSWLLSFILVVEVMAGLYACERYLYRYNEVHFSDRMAADEILQKAAKESRVFYLKEDGSNYIQAMQMMLKSKTIRVIKEEEFRQQGIGDEDFLITVTWSEFDEMLEENYDNIIKTNTFVLYYND